MKSENKGTFLLHRIQVLLQFVGGIDIIIGFQFFELRRCFLLPHPMRCAARPIETIVNTKSVAVGHSESDENDESANNGIRLIHHNEEYADFLKREKNNSDYE